MVDKLIIQKEPTQNATINRTIRIKQDCFERIMSISADTGVSFNKIVNQCLEFALEYVEIPS